MSQSTKCLYIYIQNRSAHKRPTAAWSRGSKWMRGGRESVAKELKKEKEQQKRKERKKGKKNPRWQPVQRVFDRLALTVGPRTTFSGTMVPSHTWSHSNRMLFPTEKPFLLSWPPTTRYTTAPGWFMGHAGNTKGGERFPAEKSQAKGGTVFASLHPGCHVPHGQVNGRRPCCC